MVYLANSDPLIYENMKQDWNGFQSQMLHKSYRFWDVSTGVTGPTAVAPTFSDILTLFQPGGGQILPTIGVVAPTFSLWLRPCRILILWQFESYLKTF